MALGKPAPSHANSLALASPDAPCPPVKPPPPEGWVWVSRSLPQQPHGRNEVHQLVAPDGWATREYVYPERAVHEAHRRMRSTPPGTLVCGTSLSVVGDVVLGADAQRTLHAQPIVEVEEATNSFAYDELGQAEQAALRQIGREIRDELGQIELRGLRIGQRLIAVKACLPRGRWRAWLKAETTISPDTAENLMLKAKLAARTPNLAALETRFAPTALVRLARPNVPEQAVNEAIQRAEQGEFVTVAAAQEMIRAAKAARHAPQDSPTAHAALQELCAAAQDSHTTPQELVAEAQDNHPAPQEAPDGQPAPDEAVTARPTKRPAQRDWRAPYQGIAGSGRWNPIVEQVVLVGHHPSALRPAPLEVAQVLWETESALRVKVPTTGQERDVAPHAVWCVPDAAAWRDILVAHRRLEQALITVAQAYQRLSRYDRLVLASGGPDLTPSPCTPWVIADAEREVAAMASRSPWFVPSLVRYPVLRHTAKLVVYQNEAGETGSAQQQHMYGIPDGASWDALHERVTQAQEAAAFLEGMLRRCGTYQDAGRDGRYTAGDVVTRQKPAAQPQPETPPIPTDEEESRIPPRSETKRTHRLRRRVAERAHGVFRTLIKHLSDEELALLVCATDPAALRTYGRKIQEPVIVHALTERLVEAMEQETVRCYLGTLLFGEES